MRPLINTLSLTLLTLSPLLATAQGGASSALMNAYTEIGNAVYLQANTPEALARMRKDLVAAPEAYLISVPQSGALLLNPVRHVKVTKARYNVALRLLEATDSTGSHVWPPGSLYGFELGGPGGDVRHFRTHLVRTGSTRLEFVEKLTLSEAPPVLLALQHNYLHEDAVLDPVLHTEKMAARTVIGQVVLAGPGTDPKAPLRELTLSEKNVLKLFGDKAASVKEYAAKQHLTYVGLEDVLKLVEYYNQRVAGK